jgi:hypothetical protein
MLVALPSNLSGEAEFLQALSKHVSLANLKFENPDTLGNIVAGYNKRYRVREPIEARVEVQTNQTNVRGTLHNHSSVSTLPVNEVHHGTGVSTTHSVPGSTQCIAHEQTRSIQVPAT